MQKQDTHAQWKTESFWTSPYNFREEVISDFHFRNDIELHDVTLRDGEQTPGVVLSPKEKVEIALKLDDAGVHRIEAGMPIASEDDALAIKEIVRNATRSKIFAFCRTRNEDIDAAIKCGVSSVVVEIPTMPERLEVMGLTVQDAARKVISVVQYAKSHGLFVVFFPFETTRTDFNFVISMMKAGEIAGADRLAVVDTSSASSPEGFAYLVRSVLKEIRVPLEVHCHNSLGVGVADTIAGLREGAKCAHVSINGIGETAGNVALEEVFMALKLLYGIDCGVDMTKMREASKLVEKFSGISLPVNKPVFGRNIFRRESGIVVERYYKTPKLARRLEVFDPLWFGVETEIVLGKKSGRYSILYALQKHGLQASDNEVTQILQRVKDLSISKKGLVSDDDFLNIVLEVKNLSTKKT
jgi:isopropylmalate/homocitrate/citramalate synthase